LVDVHAVREKVPKQATGTSASIFVIRRILFGAMVAIPVFQYNVMLSPYSKWLDEQLLAFVNAKHTIFFPGYQLPQRVDVSL
jgi:hypothetical protein